MRPRGTKSQAKGVCAVLLTAVLTALSACASSQGANAPRVPASPKLSDSKGLKSPGAQRSATRRAKGRSRPAKAAATEVVLDDAQIRALAAQAAPNDPAEQERLVREFIAWSKSRQKR